MNITQRTPEWFAARRLGITSTDIVAILGISPWSSEGDVAREKMGLTTPEPDDPARARRLRLGLAMEQVIKGEDEAEHGFRLKRVHRLIANAALPWALTSLDFERVGDRCIVEVKTTSTRDFDNNLP